MGEERLPDSTCLVQPNDFRLADRFRPPGLVVRRRIFGMDLGAKEEDGAPSGVPRCRR